MCQTRRSEGTPWAVVRGLIAAAALGGCARPADELPRQAVTGTVKFDGRPLDAGMIQFQPSDPGVATAGGAGISDGGYSVPRSEGLVPGKYVVTISSTPAPTAPQGGMPGDPVAPPKETIPAKYNARTTLAAEVTKEGPNKFDFDLSSKK